jgi:RNA polymerase sigma-70 factor, ECF subfamily
VTPDLQAAFAEHRPALLRHCYRMLGSHAEAEDLVQEALERAWKARESYRGEAPLKRWLFTIATNTCLNALARRRRLALPQLERDPTSGDFTIGEIEPERYITPAPDARLFPGPEELTESRESVALAFIALLQRVPPKQRAALLMKDVLGWPAEEIAAALGLSVASVNSALHRSRQAIARDDAATDEPSIEILQSFVRAWETRDLDGLVALLRDDVALAMPPYAAWFRGVENVVRFFQSPRFTAFWAAGIRLIQTRANGLPAFAFYYRSEDGTWKLRSLMLARFVGGRAAELTVFVGSSYFPSFDLELTLGRTISGVPLVMEIEEIDHDE